MYRVLIVDDVRTICRCLTELIPWEELNCLPPMVAHDGFSALEMIEASKPNIVITDLRMPVMSGAALCEEIYKRYSDIDMVFLSAYEDFHAAKIGIKYGVSDYIMKPINKDALENIQTTIRNIQQRRAGSDSSGGAAASRLINPNQEPEEKKVELVAMVKKIIHSQYDNTSLSVKQVAEQVGFSEDYLGKVFAAITGVPVYTYIRDYRIDRALELLEKTNLSVSEIAEKVGYSYPNYFAKIFKSKQGMSPSEYRNLHFRQNNLPR